MASGGLFIEQDENLSIFNEFDLSLHVNVMLIHWHGKLA